MVGPGKPLDTDRFFVIGVNNLGSCFGSTGPAVDQSGDRRALGRRLPAGHRRGLGRRAGAARRPARHRALRRGDGRQPGRHAGAVLGDPLSRSASRHALVIAAAPNLSAQNIAFNEVARQAILTDPDFHDGHFDAHGDEAAARPARGADDRPHHLPVRRADGGEVRPRSCATGSSSRSRPSSRSSRTCATRARSSPSTSTPTPTCGSPRRSTTSIRRWRPAATSRARWRRRAAASWSSSFTTDWRFSPARSREIVKALVDNRPRRRLRRDRRAARPRRLPARRSAVPRGRARLLRPHRRDATRATRRSERRRDVKRQLDGRASRDGRGAPTSRRSPAGSRRGARVLDLGCGDGSLLALPAATRAARAATASRSTTPACSPACGNGVNVHAERPRERASPASTTRRSTA